MARRIGIEIFIMLCIGLVLGLFGPFGTFENPLPMRIAFWMVFTLLGYGIFRPAITVGKWMAEALHLSQIIGIGLAQVIASVPLTFLIALLFAGFDAGKALRADGLGLLYFQVWLIGFLINGFFAIAFRGKEDAPLAPPLPDPEVPVPAPTVPAPMPDKTHDFYARLPAGFGPLLALKGEDHYVRAIGAGRDVLILLRLRDAIAELGDAPGMLVHRSWWVAADAVGSVGRDGRSMHLILTNGTSVPVARDKTAQVKAAGWR